MTTGVGNYLTLVMQIVGNYVTADSYRLHGLAFKGDGVHGAAATWIVTAPVARAVAILERCQPADEPYLFAHPLKSANHQRHHVAGRVRTSATTIKDITALAKWINTYCAVHSRVQGVVAGLQHLGSALRAGTANLPRQTTAPSANRPTAS
ncbi:hypothetical protein [Streptomyces sp. R35]|uniref:Tn3 transposase DDE domain-containing protein n=1 Tax=Streptomyces sp. R35 TaxID=3238630 RepID=A0AB39SQ89_9ACTN